MEYTKVLGAFLLVAAVRGGHLDQSGGYGSSYNGPATSYGAPTGGYSGGTAYVAPSGYNGGYNNGAGYHHGGYGGYDQLPKSYQFGYAVKDYATGNDYNRHEKSDGNTIQGEYRVQLPDGRTQIVTYIADWKNGYRAQVRYEGQAHYPTVGAYNPSSSYGAPSHHGYTGATFGGPGYSGHAGGYSNSYDSGSAPAGSTSYGPPGYGK